VSSGEPVPSVDQDAWVSLCIATRDQLAKLVPLIPAMKPDEAKTLVSALQDCMWSHHQAETFDIRVERERTKSLFTE
jgi:hypothetical protein